MRMWMVNPKILCRKHLLREHLELHMFVGTINKKKKMDGYLNNNLLEPQSLEKRHKEISEEMIRRKYSHNSDLPKFEFDIEWNINKEKALKDLISRCPECKMRWEENETFN